MILKNPLNSKLSAGDVIALKIPTQNVGEVTETDEEISGSYLIKDIFDRCYESHILFFRSNC